MDPISIYINWAMHAIHGQLGGADLLMQRFGTEIRFVADFLAHESPIASAPIYRGVLLDPSSGLGTHYPFVSWSEDRDVACWFADRHSYISEPFRAMAPEARGYLLALPAPRSRVLFHYSWRDVFGRPLEAFALQHPMIGPDGHRQIAWSLDHQREVITEPVEGLSLMPYEASPEETKRLDRRFVPSWITVAVCPGCNKPAHASESDDDDYHTGCRPSLKPRPKATPEGKHRGMSAPRVDPSSAT